MPTAYSAAKTMMTFNDFKKANRCWEGLGYCATEEEWNSNYKIAAEVEKKFYTHYDMSKMSPQKGDVIEFVSYNRRYLHALVENVDRYGLMYVCGCGSTHTDGERFSTSGGAFTHIHESKFEFVGYENRTFWTWGCYGAGGNQGIYFTIKVKKFRQKDMKVIPNHRITFGGEYLKGEGVKVSIEGSDVGFWFESFKTIKEFNEWKDYVGLTYRKTESGLYYANQFLKSEYFWKLEDLPDGCKPIEDWCNGQKVRCFVWKNDDTITIYRPNPNAKEVYVPMNG